MRDHNYQDREGRLIPIAELPTCKIIDLLYSDTLNITNTDGHGSGTIEEAKERLRIELLIRELGL